MSFWFITLFLSVFKVCLFIFLVLFDCWHFCCQVFWNQKRRYSYNFCLKSADIADKSGVLFYSFHHIPLILSLNPVP